MIFDAAGNLTRDTYSAAAVTRTYDAENRMTSETTYNSVVSGTYLYDGDGRRVKRTVGGVETWQVYGLGGELIAEYAQNGSPATPQKEYGYRNGQSLITATVSSGGWGAAPSFDDNPLNPPNQPKTDVKAIHITQLRAAINALHRLETPAGELLIALRSQSRLWRHRRSLPLTSTFIPDLFGGDHLAKHAERFKPSNHSNTGDHPPLHIRPASFGLISYGSASSDLGSIPLREVCNVSAIRLICSGLKCGREGGQTPK